MIRIWRYVRALSANQVWLLMALMLIMGPVGFLAGWWWRSQPPVVTLDVYEDDDVAIAGGELVLIARKVERASCLTAVARWLWRPDPLNPSRTQWREITSTPHSPPTLIGRTAEYRLSVPLPAGIEPGEWHYQGQAVDVCASPLRSGPRFSRDILVTILPPSPDPGG